MPWSHHHLSPQPTHHHPSPPSPIPSKHPSANHHMSTSPQHPRNARHDTLNGNSDKASKTFETKIMFGWPAQMFGSQLNAKMQEGFFSGRCSSLWSDSFLASAEQLIKTEMPEDLSSNTHSVASETFTAIYVEVTKVSKCIESLEGFCFLI